MIKVVNVVKAYQTRFGPRRVLDGVSFELARGQNVGILGRNGAGKSTLIRLLAGAERPTSGTITRGMSVSWPLAFGDAFQGHLTGFDNLKFIARVYDVDYKSMVGFVEDFTELGHYMREPVSHYSSGMVTRLAFALSMAIEFDCFLIDEVLVVGDRRFHERCHYELFDKRRDRAFILVTHDMASIKRYCSSACVLSEGRLYQFDDVAGAAAFYDETTQSRNDEPQPEQLSLG